MGWGDVGDIASGRRADLVVLSPGLEVREVLHRGEGEREGMGREPASRALDRYELAHAANQTFERVVIDGGITGGSAGIVRAGSAAVRALQSGFLRAYAGLGEKAKALEAGKKAIAKAPDEPNRKNLERLVKKVEAGEPLE